MTVWREWSLYDHPPVGCVQEPWEPWFLGRLSCPPLLGLLDRPLRFGLADRSLLGVSWFLPLLESCGLGPLSWPVLRTW